MTLAVVTDSCVLDLAGLVADMHCSRGTVGLQEEDVSRFLQYRALSFKFIHFPNEP